MRFQQRISLSVRKRKPNGLAGWVGLGLWLAAGFALSTAESGVIEPDLEVGFVGFSQFEKNISETPLAPGIATDSAQSLLDNATKRLAVHWSEKLSLDLDSSALGSWGQWFQTWALRPWAAQIYSNDAGSSPSWTFQVGANLDEALNWSQALRNSLDLPNVPLPFDRKYGDHDGWRIDFSSIEHSLHCVATAQGLVLSWESLSGKLAESLIGKFGTNFTPTSNQALIELKAKPAGSSWLNDWLQQWSNAAYTLSIQVRVEGKTFRVGGFLDWEEPVDIQTGPWMFPNELVRDPLIQLSAIRLGKESRFAREMLNPLGYSTAPEQVFTWSMPGNPMQTFVAFPADKELEQLKEWIPDLAAKLNQWIQPVKLGQFNASEDSTKAIWNGFPFNLPFVGVVDSDVWKLDPAWSKDEAENLRTSFVMAGFFPPNLSVTPAPEGLLKQFSGSEKMVYYGWELTSLEMKKWGQYLQLVEMISKERPDPEQVKKLQAEGRLDELSKRNPAVDWILEMEKQFGNTITVWEAESPTRWTLNRKAPAILNGFEMAYLLRTLGDSKFPAPVRFIPQNNPLPKPSGPTKPMFFYANPKPSKSKPGVKRK